MFLNVWNTIETIKIFAIDVFLRTPSTFEVSAVNA